MAKTIKVTCRGADTLPIDRILEFQGNLKHISKTNKERLKASILRHGFTAPMFVWDDQGEWRLLDGHQRLATLISMRQEGYDIPMLPVDYIQAENEKEAREKLLNITSQYGEFDMEELNSWVEQCDEELQKSVRLVDEELSINIEYEELEKYTERGGSYNDKELPEIEQYKLPYRIEAIIKTNQMKCIELFAGRKALTYWYERVFKKVITNDMQVFDDIEHDYNMKANDFIKRALVNHIDFDYIDFDDEGCPAKEIQEFFKIIKDKNEPFVLAVTDGMGLNLKCLGKINYYKTYMIREDKTVQPVIEDYYNFTDIFREFIREVTQKNNFKHEELSLHLKENGNVIYATYFIEKV